MPITKLLIANRGEIACRIIRTARRMNMATVAVHSDADAGAMHVEMADEAVRIGPAPAAESYLRSDEIIAAALSTGANAIHPGYGFLSENPKFVEAVEAVRLIFVGPSAAAIRAMGLKDEAKRTVEGAGVPVVPGYHGKQQDLDFLKGEAEKTGYPVLIKARAGGGGKGMRLVEKESQFAEALEGAVREGLASFGDGQVLIEKFITNPRHIEIQVFGDKSGQVVHLFERDCSLQRRHQKVIEEAPAPGMTKELRLAMGGAAVRAAQSVGYSGAGTVEFIVDGSGPLRRAGFWFMEMNTRLQVEHPVTEMITGIDLVEWQLRVAAAEPLPMNQKELNFSGWAFEARLYAEDVPAGFLPATGKLKHLVFPDNVRVDTGVRAGDVITPHYDPMIAKIIVHGATRKAALAGLSRGLENTEIAGTVTNIDFLRRLVGHGGFAAGEFDTGLIERHRKQLIARDSAAPVSHALAALAAGGYVDGLGSNDLPDKAQLHSFRLWAAAESLIKLVGPYGEFVARITHVNGDQYQVWSKQWQCKLQLFATTEGKVRVTVNRHTIAAKIVRFGSEIAIIIGGRTVDYKIPDPLTSSADELSGGDLVIAPMPGTVKLVAAKSGDTINGSSRLVVLEAMKMEHTLNAPRDGVIAEVLVAEGDQVEEGAVLISLTSND